MSASPEDVRHIAKLANLSLDKSELQKLSQEFEAILDFVRVLQEAKVEETLPTHHVSELENVFRPDEVVAFEHHRILLEGEDLFQVPGVFQE